MRVVSEFSYVRVENDNKVYECKAKGNFRYQDIKPVVGDYVKFNLHEDNKGLIYEIAKRTNELYRPRIANIDQVIIITAIKEPEFNTYLLDKYLAFIEYQDLNPVIVFTKTDLILKTDLFFWKYFQAYQKMGYQVYCISNYENDRENWDKLKEILKNKISVFTGQTGSGKSSTINTLLKTNDLKTQQISKALGRGKHTTTASALYEVNGGMIGDTPGFSSFDLQKYTKNDIAISYRLFADNIANCKFRSCLHLKEPGCKIKILVQDEIIPQFFYDDYVRIMNEL